MSQLQNIKNRLQHFVLNNINLTDNPEQIKQITKVLRLRENDKIIGICENKKYLLEIKNINKSCIEFSTLEILQEKILNKNLKIYIPVLNKSKKTELIL